MALDQHHPAGIEVAHAGGKELPAPRRVGRVDEVAGEHDSIEAPPQVQALDPGQDRRGPMDVGQHRGGLVHPGRWVTERHQRICDSPCPAAEFQHRCPRGRTLVISSGSPAGRRRAYSSTGLPSGAVFIS